MGPPGVKFDFAPHARWSPFVYASGEHDRLRELALRVQGGAGAKYTLWRATDGEAALSVAGLYDREAILGGELNQTARWSWRVKVERKLATAIRLRHVTYYQPVWGQPGDYLLSTVTSMDSPVMPHVALAMSYDFERDATPPDGVRRDDQVVNVGLKFAF